MSWTRISHKNPQHQGMKMLINTVILFLRDALPIFIVFVLLLAIAFETFQQLFYIKRFQLSQNIDFFELLRNQFYKWIIWFFIGIALPFLIKKDVKKEPDFKLFFKYILIILLLVVINIFIISCLQILILNETVSIHTFFLETNTQVEVQSFQVNI